MFELFQINLNLGLLFAKMMSVTAHSFYLSQKPWIAEMKNQEPQHLCRKSGVSWQGSNSLLSKLVVTEMVQKINAQKAHLLNTAKKRTSIFFNIIN